MKEQTDSKSKPGNNLHGENSFSRKRERRKNSKGITLLQNLLEE